MPAGLVVASPNGLNGTCGSGTVSTTATSVSLSNGTIAANSSCRFSVNVTAVAVGSQVNTTGNVNSANAGSGNAATATINVLAPDLTIALSSPGNFFKGQTGATYTVKVSNAGAGSTAGAVTVNETIPAGLTIIGLSGTGWTCNGTSCARSDVLAASGSYPPITVVANVATSAPDSVTNSVSVSGGGELDTANDIATDAVTVTVPPDFTLTQLQAAPPTVTIVAGQVASYAFTIAPGNNSFTKPIIFTVTDLPGQTSASFSPASVTLGSKPANVGLTIFTAKGSSDVAGNFRINNRIPVYAFVFPFAGLLLGFTNRKWMGGARSLTLVALLLVCGGFGVARDAQAATASKVRARLRAHIPLKITATSGSLQHTSTVTLIVKP